MYVLWLWLAVLFWYRLDFEIEFRRVFFLFLLLRRRSCNFFSSVALFKTQLNCNIIFVFFFYFTNIY